MHESNNNYLLGFLLGLLIVLILFGPVVINSYIICQKKNSHASDYDIVSEFNYANGKFSECKLLKDGTIAWRKDNGPGYANLYAKYNIGHDKPLYKISNGTSYVNNHFICFVTDFKKHDWWHFEKWKWYFFEDVSCEFYDNFLFASAIFFDFLEKNDLPQEEVQKTYNESVNLFNDEEKFNQYLFGFIESHERQSVIALVADVVKTGKLPSDDMDWQTVGFIIEKYRDDFPDNLPEVILDKLADENIYVDYKSERMIFGLCNYLLRPTEYNALHLIYRKAIIQPSKEPQDEKFLPLNFIFETLHDHDRMLEKFLSQIYSDDMVTPPLPPPVSSDVEQDNSDQPFYYSDTYENLPEREKLLKISCFPEVFKTYWEERLKKLQEKQKAQ